MVNINANEISTDDLIEALEHHYLEQWEMEKLARIIGTSAGKKMKLFLKVMNRYSTKELEEMFAEKVDAHAGPNQIELPLNK